MKNKNTILVFRFSSFGDVAMTVPVIQEFMDQNPDAEIIYISRLKFKDLFPIRTNFHFYAVDIDTKYKGILGLYKLAKELKSFKPTYIADLHNVLRTKILGLFLNGIKSQSLDKGRKDRKELLNSTHSKKPLKLMSERYADVFRNLGFTLNLSHQLPNKNIELQNAIGIAPFAMYSGKMYPLEKMRKVATSLAESRIKVYLFGGGKEEKEVLESWENLHPNLKSTVEKLNLNEELELIKSLKLMVSMDSANMHLASLVGTPVISIWGTTHPFMGFLGYGQSMDDVIQDETIAIRPTSVFGKESEPKKIDYFEHISEEEIINKIKTKLNF